MPVGASGEPVADAPGLTAPSRLARARAVLAQAEARTGLRTAVPGSAPDAVPGAAVPAHGGPATAAAPRVPGPGSRGGLPAPATPWEAVGPTAAGLVSLTGSTTLLLAAAARRQGAQGWCAVLGGQDIGWCAAAEAGLDLARVLVVRARDLAPAVLPAVVGALVDGLDVVLLTGGASRLLAARQQQAVAARARARGCLVLLDEPWDGARLLQAWPEGTGTRLPEADGTDEGAADDARAGGAGVLPLRPPAHSPRRRPACVPAPARAPAEPGVEEPEEMPAGYLRHLDWSLTEPRRGPATSLLRSGPDGVRVLTGREPRAGQDPRTACRPGPALTVLPGGLP